MKRLAGILRRLADRVEPPLVDDEPLAFITTDEMLAELKRRTDQIIVFTCKDLGNGTQRESVYYQLNGAAIKSALMSIRKAIRNHDGSGQ